MKKLTLVLFTLLTLIPHVVWGEDKEISSGTHYFLLHDDDGDVHTATFIRSSSQSIIVIPSTIGYEEKQYTVTAIGENAFSNCHELNLTIPSTITTIHENAFNGASIKNITVNNDNETYQSINDVLFTKSWKTLICYPSEKEATEYTITPDVTSIQPNAFKNCKYLQTLIFSSSFLVSETNIDFSTVKAFTESKFSIRYNGVAYYQNENNWKVGNGTAGSGLVDGYPEDITILNNVNSKKVNLITPNAFTGIDDIYTLKFDRDSRLHETLSGVDFSSMETDLEIFAGGIRYVHVGTWTSSSSHFQVGTGTNGTGYDSSTESYSDSEVTIAENINEIPVTEIADKAFIGVQNISLTIPKSVVSLSTSAFVGIDYNSRNQLSSITVEKGNPKYKSYNGALYYYDDEKKKIELITCPWNGSIITRSLSDWLPGVTAIGIDAFKNHRNLTSIEIPASVITIGQSAFQYAGYDMFGLTVTFEDESELTTIGQNAFQESKVQSINLPSGLTSIGASAFKQCRELTTINLPASLSTIGGSAFLSCSKLTTVNLPASLTSIGERAFSGCYKLETITFAESYVPGLTINNYAFYNCKLNETVEVKPGVTKIGDHAFDWSDDFRTQGQMKTFRVPSTVTTYGENVVYRKVTVQRKMELDFGSDKYLTYYSPQNIGLSDGQSDVLKAYIITGINEGDHTVQTKLLNYIHKDQALLLELIEGKELPEWYNVPDAETMDLDNGVDFTTNLLKGSATGIDDMSKLIGDKYVLTGNQFVKVHQGSLPAMRCYLSVDNGAPASNLYIKDGSSNTFIIYDEGTLVNKNSYASIGSASLEKDGTKMKLTVKPGTSGLYYANPGDIIVKRNVTAISGRAPAIDQTTYKLTVIGEEDPDPSQPIAYHFTPTSEDDVYEVTVNFHKRKDFNDNNATRVVTLSENRYKYDGTAHKPDVEKVKYNEDEVDSKNYDITYVDSINAGKGKVIIKGKREFMNEFPKEFDIDKRDINEVTVDPDPIPDQVYTGSAIKPSLTSVKFGENKLVEGIDYDVTYSNNVNVTTDAQPARINIVSKEKNYTSTKPVYFKIVPKDLSTEENKATIIIPAQDYTGSAIEPTNEITVKDGEKTLELGTDYYVEYPYEDNIEAGEATVKITFKGNYKGTLEKKFTIVDPGLERTVTVSFDTKNEWTTYYSSENLKLTDVANELEAYIVTGIEGQKVNTEKSESTNKVSFIPKNTAVLLHRISGSKTSFDVKTCSGETLLDGIQPSDIFQGTLEEKNIATVDIDKTKFVLLNGKFIQTAEGTLAANRCYLVVDDLGIPELTIGKTDGIIYQQDGTVATSNIGTASKSEPDKDGMVTLTVKPNKGFYVEARDITVVRNAEAGKGRAPQIDNGAVTVTLKEGGITDDVENNTSTYLFTYNVENDCQYQVTVNFHPSIDITKAGEQPTIAFIDPTYNGSEQKVEPTVTTYDGKKLTKDIDYVLIYPGDDYTNAGNNKKVTVQGIRKYTNYLNKPYFNIKKRDFSLVTFSAKEGQTWVEGHTPADETPQIVFTGSAIELDIADIVNDKNILTDDEATITYAADITNAGKTSVTVKSKGVNYQGEKTFNYTILPKEMTAENIADIPEQTYTGSEIKPSLTIKYGKIKLMEGDDYDVTYTDNVKAGTATATVNFKGNYAGENITKTFTIEEAKETLTINFDSENEWTTYYGTRNLELTDALKAYVVTGHNGKEVLTEEVNFIPKETPVLLHRISGSDTSFDVMTCSGKTLDTQPCAIFKGTLEGLDISTVSGTKFVLLNGEFVQTTTGTLAANRCYLVTTEPIEGVTTLVIGKGISEVITMEEGQESTAGGSARVITTPDENNNLTLVVSPKSGYYADLEDLTVIYSVKAGSARAPEVAPGKVELTPVEGYDDTSKEFRYTFPYTTDEYFYQVTVNFHHCVNFQTKETQPTITLEEGIFAYDGTEKKPKVASVTMFDGTVTLTEGKDFTVTYQNNVNAGPAQAYITGKNHYTSTFHKDFNIAQRDIKLVTVEAIPDQIYNGSKIEPEVVVKDIVQIDGADVDLINKVENKPDYTPEYIDDNIDVGTYRVNINANKINYTGVKTGTTFEIKPKNLNLEGNEPTIDPIEPQIYTGEPIEPDLVIRDGDLVVPADNYDVEYKDNIVEGTATAIINFKKNYEGKATTNFEITYKKERKQLYVDFGSQDEWTTYYSPIDLDNVEGLNIFVVTGLNKGQGLDLKTEQINYIPKNIGVLLQRTDKTKTEFFGETMSSTTKLEGVTPDTDLYRGTITGIDNLKAIDDGIKYILLNDRFIQVVEGALPAYHCYVFINNDNNEGINHVEGEDADGIVIQEEGEDSKTAGKVDVSGVSSDGYKTITVSPAPVNYATQDEVKVVRSIRNEAPAASSHRVPGIENTLVEVIPVNANADPSGTTTYKFKYDANYHYQVTVNFQNRIDLSKTAVYNPVVTLKAADIQNLEYDGMEKRPSVEKVTCNNVVVDPSNYDISYENNVNAGMPRVIITGKRFLMGSTHAEFSISKRNFSHVTVEEPIADKEYTGLPITPTVVIKDIVNDKNIVNSNDYELVLENNIEEGTAKVTIKPKNNYYGSYKDYYFNIIPSTVVKGDANADGFVNVTDIVATVNFIMERPSPNFTKVGADVNGDGVINVTDIVKMVSIIMSSNSASTRRAAATGNMVFNGTGIQLKNAEDYTAAQFDINLSDGQSVCDVFLNGSSDHSLTWKMVNNNTCRVVVYSMTNEPFGANGDNLINIMMTGSQDAAISNEILVRNDGVTAIDAIRMETEDGKIFDLRGRQVKNPRKGLYIINGKKVIIK